MIQSLGNNVQEVGPNLVQALMSLGDIDIDVSAIQPGEKKKSKTVLPFFPSAADFLSLSLSLSLCRSCLMATLHQLRHHGHALL